MTQTVKERSTTTAAAKAPAVDTKLEIVVIPVSDVDRAKAFYANLGWRLDADFAGEGWRAIQFTPPGSPSTRSAMAASTMRTGRTGMPSTSSRSRPAKSCRCD